jgi:hypothetical protein
MAVLRKEGRNEAWRGDMSGVLSSFPSAA